MKYLYKYPQAAYPYDDLVETNRRRTGTRWSMSCSIPASSMRTATSMSSWSMPKRPDDILVQITAVNRGPEAAELHLLPTLWFRNDWASWIAEPIAPETARSSRSTDAQA